MIYWLYEYLLKRQITHVPAHICFMISGQDLADAPGNLALITSWCNELSEFVARRNPSAGKGIRGLTFHIGTSAPEDMRQYLAEVRKIGTISHLILHIGDKEETYGRGMDVVVAIGNSGREEITACIRRMAQDHLRPEDVNEKTFESYLTFQYTPGCRDQDRGRSPHGFSHMAVGVFRTFLLGRKLEIPQKSGFFTGGEGLPVTGTAFWKITGYPSRILIQQEVPPMVFSAMANLFFSAVAKVFRSGTAVHCDGHGTIGQMQDTFPLLRSSHRPHRPG